MALPNLVQIKQALDKMMPELSPVPIGSIAYAHEVPTGWLECNGAAISRTKYARLFKKIGTKYGAGDGSTTFNLPNLHHRVLEATTTISEVAKTVEAGLPDISGTIKNYGGRVGFERVDGVFFSEINEPKIPSLGVDSPGNSSVQQIRMMASKDSAVYGKTSITQMASLRALAIIKS